jgi:hypothetical protein
MFNFLQVQGNRRHCAEVQSCTPHKRFQTCHAYGVIDAEIAEKGHLWMETTEFLDLAEIQFSTLRCIFDLFEGDFDQVPSVKKT